MAGKKITALSLMLALTLSAQLFIQAVALAQTDQGSIVGTVRDQANAEVPGASITLKNERTGEERAVYATEQGQYLVTALKPSFYTISVKAQGFSNAEFTNVQLSVGQELTLDVELKPSGTSESITVVGTQEAAIDTSSARIGANVSEREVVGLPINGRQLSQLYLQAPGSQNSGSGTFGDIRFSGRAVEQNAIRYDGIEGSAIIDASPGNVNGELPSPFRLQSSLENVQEFRVESNSYPAEYGTGTGGQISVVTKSGSNGVRGSALALVRSDKSASRNYCDSQRNPDGTVITALPKSTLKQNQFGGSMGGPLAKDKAFFFGSYEGYRLDAGLNFIEGVPSDAAWAKAVPAIAPLRPGFLAAGAVV